MMNVVLTLFLSTAMAGWMNPVSRDSAPKVGKELQRLRHYMTGKGIKKAWAEKLDRKLSEENRRVVVLFPSMMGSSLYATEETMADPKKYEHCHLGKTPRVWISSALILASKANRKKIIDCYAEIMTLQPTLDEDTQDFPIKYGGNLLRPDFGNVEDARALLNEHLSAITDAADVYHNIIEMLHYMRYEDGKDLLTAQYDWRVPLVAESDATREYVKQILQMLKQPIEEGRKIAFGGFSMGGLAMNEVLRTMHIGGFAEAEQALIEKFFSLDIEIVHMMSAEGGAVQTAVPFLTGGDQVEALFQERPSSVRAMNSWGTAVSLFPSCNFNHDWLVIVDDNGEKVESYSSQNIQDFYAKYYPNDQHMIDLGKGLQWQCAHWDDRKTQMQEVYRKVQHTSCIEGTGIPTAREVHLKRKPAPKQKGERFEWELWKVLYADGDGTVPAESQALCAAYGGNSKDDPPMFLRKFSPPAEVLTRLDEAKAIAERTAPYEEEKQTREEQIQGVKGTVAESHSNLPREDAFGVVQITAILAGLGSDHDVQAIISKTKKKRSKKPSKLSSTPFNPPWKN